MNRDTEGEDAMRIGTDGRLCGKITFRMLILMSNSGGQSRLLMSFRSLFEKRESCVMLVPL